MSGLRTAIEDAADARHQSSQGGGDRRVSKVKAGDMHLELVAIVVDGYDQAIEFFVDRLGFDLVEDTPAKTNDGRPKRWVVVRPPEASTGILLARADGDQQRLVVGRQHAGRVGFFLRVDDFDASYARMLNNDVEFVTAPANEPSVGSPSSSTSPATVGTCSVRARLKQRTSLMLRRPARVEDRRTRTPAAGYSDAVFGLLRLAPSGHFGRPDHSGLVANWRANVVVLRPWMIDRRRV